MSDYKITMNPGDTLKAVAKRGKRMKALRPVALLLFPLCLRAQNVQVPVPPVTPPPMSIGVKVTGAPAGCVQGAPSFSGNTITAPLSGGPCGGTPPPPTCPVQIKPTGGTDNSNWVTQMNAAVKGGTCVEIVPGNYILLPPFNPPSNVKVSWDDGVFVKDSSASYAYNVEMINMASGDVFTGIGPLKNAMVSMPNAYARNRGNTNTDVNQYNHCVNFNGSTGASVIGLRFDKCGGDSIYLNNAVNATVRGNVSTNPIRNGISVTDNTTGVTIDSNDFSLATNCTNAKICNGGDVEPNKNSSWIRSLVITNNNFHDNGGVGLCMCFFFLNSSTVIDATVSNNRASNNAGSVNGHPPTGNIGYMKDSWPSPMNGSVKGSGNTDQGKPVAFPN